MTATTTAKEEVVEDVSPEHDGAVLKRVVREGDKGPNSKPWNGDHVTVHYTGTLGDVDGEKFDSSVDRKQPFRFNLGKSEVIKGWDVGVATMSKGEVAIFTIRADFAYGQTGSPPKIPAGATLVFRIELIDFCGEDLSQANDQGIVKRIKKPGDGFDRPNDNGMVTVSLVGRRDSVVFDQREDVTFVLGEGDDCNVPMGLELALKKMKQGEEAQIRLSPGNAFGANGCKPLGVPADNSHVLEYDVHLKSFERAKESWQLDGDQKLEQSTMFKEKGTAFFKANKLDMAVNKYQKVVELLEQEVSLKGEKETERRETLRSARLNLALCWLKKGMWIDARNVCDKVLEDHPGVPKAHFRRGEALLQLNDNELAREDFKHCLELEPDNKAAKNKVAYCTQQIKKERDTEKKTFANMFDRFAKTDARKEAERKRREKPVEINDWDSDKSSGKGANTIDVSGDIEMKMDLDAAVKQEVMGD